MKQRTRRTPPPGLGPMLNRARLRTGYRLREAERLLDVTHPYLLRLESGDRVPSVTIATRLADLLDLDDDERATLLAAAVDDAGADHPLRRTDPGVSGRTSGPRDGRRVGRSPAYPQG